MKLTESYLKRLIKQAINEMQDPFSVTAQDPALDYQDLYDEYVRNGVKMCRFHRIIPINTYTVYIGMERILALQLKVRYLATGECHPTRTYRFR
jgi:hypothetical protein